MIGALEGRIRLKKTDGLILMVGGVGYLVFLSAQLLSRTRVGEELKLYTHTHVRQDALSLFGFTTSEELTLFELLLSVSGIGPKSAVAIVDRGVEAVKNAVATADVGFFTSIPRLGTKGAQKVIIELKSKLGSLTELDLQGYVVGETQEVVEALTNLGFSKMEVLKVLTQLPPEVTTVEDKVRYAFKLLGEQKPAV